MGSELNRRKAPLAPSFEGIAESERFPTASEALTFDVGTNLRPEPARATRWFAAIDHRALPAPPRRRSYGAVLLFIIALALVAVARGIMLRALLPVALAAAAIALVLRGRRRRAAARAATRRRGIALDEQRLSFEDGPAAQTLLSTATPFGVTLLTTRLRDRVVAAVSSGSGTFYVGASFDAAARRAYAGLLVRASMTSVDEAGLEAMGPDGEPLDLTPADLAALLEDLGATAPGCLDRLVLSDAQGAPLLVDAHELRIGERRFDLSLPLEWRAFVFQEPFGQAVTVYQATWIRQGAGEVVLVSLLPSLAPAGAGEIRSTGIAELDRAAIRDLRLMQATPDEPPPTEQRVAVERLFMLPLRITLDRRRDHCSGRRAPAPDCRSPPVDHRGMGGGS
jgi:hypothetical protein